MARKQLIRTHQFPYHITSRSNNKEWFYIPTDCVWKYAKILLRQGSVNFNTKIHAFVLMSNHYHLIIRTPDSNIDAFMQYFNKQLGQSISRSAGRINRIFGAPYKWSLIQDQNYYLNVYRYIYQNPLRASLAKKVEDYPYSTLSNGKLDQIVCERLIEMDGAGEVLWLNQEVLPKEISSIKRGLKKDIFLPGRDLTQWKRPNVF